MMNKFIAIFVTFSSKKEAEAAVDSLLKKRLVACANILDTVESKFWWHGKIDKSKEVLAIFKTSIDNFKIVEKEVKAVHSYEVPEIIAIPIAALSSDYAKWLRNSVNTVLK